MRKSVNALDKKKWIAAEIVSITALDTHLPQLVDCYRAALKKVEQFPRVGRVRTAVVQKIIDGEYEKALTERADRRWVVRPLVRLFVETHVRAKLDAIARALRIESMTLRAASNTRAKKIRSYIGWLDDSMESLFTWSRLRTTLSKVPYLSTVLALMAAFVARLTGIDLSSTEALTESTLGAGKTGDWMVFFDIVKVLSVVLLYAYVLLVPVIVQLGFRVKRAIFAGGKTLPDLFEWIGFFTSIRRKIARSKEETEMVEEERWAGFPGSNIYQKENHVFAILGVRKPTEFPIDFILTVKIYYLFFFAVIFGVGIVQAVATGGTLKVWDFGGIFLWILLAIYLVSGVHHYRVRKNSRNM